MRLLPRLLVVLAVLAAPLSAADAAAPRDGRGDATVIAVIDSAFSPYHWDYLASKMPQARNKDRSDDLPLTTAPDKWLPGFPSTRSFSSYNKLPLTLEGSDPATKPQDLDAKDKAKWDAVKSSDAKAVHYYWMPGTKVIGALTFGPTPFSRYNPDSALGTPGHIHGDTSEHGMGTTSVSVGNLNGTCPECLLVFIQYTDAGSAELAINWAMRQPWIDAISNSYGISSGYAVRDRVYNGSDVALQRAASQRGQTVFFSAGNGMENAFTVPNSTLESSQEGPDWIVTVTATDPNGGTYTGTGKPADVAGIGVSYPSAYEAEYVSSRGKYGFSGTSNATPTIAGTYGRALYLARRTLPGDSRTQSAGVVAKGSFRCGKARTACELAGGLTANELRMRLLQSAVSTGKGYTDGLLGLTTTPRAADSQYAAEGHGTYAARLHGDKAWLAEFDRLWKPLVGAAKAPARPAGEKEWFLVDSWCRQHIWGEWSGGYYKGGALPADDPNYPTRTSLHNACQNMQQPPK
ncbi:MAG TPA: S8/S53 family peptidase [Mycobacteriales bacterium]|jgi:hypothetical protein|nr:S8/S53 family peptidase [Mycobacteriales bacterium]